MRAVDTNVLIRLFTRDDAHQAIVADRFIENGAWVPQLAIVEAVWVLGYSYGSGTGDLIRFIEMLLSHTDLIVQDADVVRSALELFRARPVLGFADCMMIEIARKAGHLPLGTFDRALGKVDGTDKL
jgi:predicted nucleic-acid-binding protein